MTVELVVFAISAAAAIIGALGVVSSKNAVYAALMLVLTLFAVAVLFVAQDAHFLAVVQVIVYAGAVVVLFLFVIMLLGIDQATSLELGSLRFQLFAAASFAAAAVAVVIASVVLTENPASGEASVSGVLAANPAETATYGSSISALGRSLFSDYLYAFELTSLLLVVAVIGTVVLAQKRSA